jgi:hypothetical protein
VGLLRKVRKGLTIRRRLEAAPPVLIYQMGKVGSSSLKASLTPSWPGLTIHVHSIKKELERRRREVTLVYERVIRNGGPLFVISPVREPIGRNVSLFFQNFERHTGIKYNESAFSIEELIRIFLQKSNHDGPAAWHDSCFKPILGIDVYDYEFPSSGIQVITHRNTRLLLMRCELPDSVKEPAVREFLNLPTLSLLNKNVADEKDYAETYKKFKEAFIAPDWYIHKMYESRFFNHFYGESQKNSLIKRWTQNKMPCNQRSLTHIDAFAERHNRTR